MTDFADLMSRSLPGIYRLKDDSGDLAQFLQLIASPLAEIEASIGQLYDDLFGATAQGELLPLIGALIGADIDPSLPASLQRAALEDTLPFYRSKGMAGPLASTVQASTGWQTVAVDYSQVVARLPHVETLSPMLRRRGRPVGVDPGGTGRFTFDAAAQPVALFDEQRGRAIARTEIATLAADLVGTDRGFAIRDGGVDLVGPRAASPRPVVGADLTDFASPRQPDGTPLALAATQIAVDPELGRMLFAAPLPLAGNLTVDFHQLVPASIAPETFDLRDATRVVQLGRSDDPAPYTLDVRSPDRPSDRFGRTHFDNHGLFVTVGRSLADRHPDRLRVGPPDGFSFDDRPLAPGDTTGTLLQLQDGIDGAPLTVARLAGHEADYADAPRGFTIRAGGLSLLDPSFGGARVIAARLADLAHPTDAGGAPLVLQPRDIAVDPQLGRFLLDPAAFGIAASDLRVGYLLAAVGSRIAGAAPAPVVSGGSNTSAVAADGSTRPLRDALDGTQLAAKLHLGAAITDFHGTPRGYRVFAGATDLTVLLSPQVISIDDPIAVAPGVIAIDLDRGWFAVPAGTIPAGAAPTVEYSAADTAAETRTFDSLAQRLPRLVPAGVVPVVVDTRKRVIDPATFELLAKATTP